MNKILRGLIGICLGVLLFLEFYFLYSGKFDCLQYDKAGTWLAGGVLLLFIPATFWILSKIAFTNNENMQIAGKWIGMLSIVINGPCFGVWSGHHETACYEKHGVRTNGIVTSAFYSKGERMYYEFSINDTLYTSFNVANPLNHKMGDSLTIIYNSLCPKMNSAIENCKKHTANIP